MTATLEPGPYWVRLAGHSDSMLAEYDGQFVRFFGVETRARPDQIHEWGPRIDPPPYAADPALRAKLTVFVAGAIREYGSDPEHAAGQILGQFEAFGIDLRPAAAWFAAGDDPGQPEPPDADPGRRGAQLARELFDLAMKQRHVLSPDSIAALVDVEEIDPDAPPEPQTPGTRRYTVDIRTTPLSEVHRCTSIAGIEVAPRYDGVSIWLHQTGVRGWHLRGATTDGLAMSVRFCPWCGAELPPGPEAAP